MSIRTHRLGALGVAGLLTCGALLSGCGVSDEELRPGVAAQVGSTEIALDDIDDAVDVACGFFVDEGQPGFPRALARQQFASVLVMRAAASQALEEQGLEVGSDYARAVGGLDAANAQIPAAQRPPFVLLNDATTYVDAAAATLGEAAFAAEGDVPADPAVVADRGRTVISAWLDDHQVDINPSFRLTVADGQVVSDTGGTSVAVSDGATAALLDPATATGDEVSAAADQLPPSQLCGAGS